MIYDTVWKCGDGVVIYTDLSKALSTKCDFIGDVVSADDDPLVLIFPPWASDLRADPVFLYSAIKALADGTPEKGAPSEWLFRLGAIRKLYNPEAE